MRRLSPFFPLRSKIRSLPAALLGGVLLSTLGAPAATATPAPREQAPNEAGQDAPQTRERHWLSSLETARAEAKKTGKLIFVDLFAEWCGWCRVLDREVFSRPVFDPLAQKMVLVRLDVEDGGEGSETQARFQIYDLPTTLVLEASGALVGKVTGVVEPPRYVARIEHQIEAHRKVLELYDRWVASAGKDIDPEQMLELAEGFHQHGDGKRAAALYRLLDRLGWSDPKGKALLPLRLADALRMTGDYPAAEHAAEHARQLANQAQAGPLVEAIDLLDIQIATDEGDCARRRETLKTFLRRHPDSERHTLVESSLAALENGADGAGCS